MPTGTAGESYGLGLFQSQAMPCGTETWNYEGQVDGYRTFWMSNADGTKQVILVGTEFHGIENAAHDTDPGTALAKAFCALS